MMTRVIPVDKPQALTSALALLRAGKPIVFPTDTVYGIGCDHKAPEAIERLYTAKQRPRHMAIPLLLASAQDVYRVAVNVPPILAELAEAFWPGGLTLIVERSPSLPDVLTAGKDSVAIRIPDHPLARELCRRMGGALATSSANLSGASAPTTAEQALTSLAGRVALILDGGPAPGGQASSIVDLSQRPPRLLREGPISPVTLRSLLPDLVKN